MIDELPYRCACDLDGLGLLRGPSAIPFHSRSHVRAPQYPINSQSAPKYADADDSSANLLTLPEQTGIVHEVQYPRGVEFAGRSITLV